MAPSTKDEAWLEAFERDLAENEDQAYLKYSKELLSRDDLTYTSIAADPLILLTANLSSFSHQRIEAFIRIARYWRWKSRHYYEPICSQAEFPQVLERQDTALLRSLFVQISNLETNGDEKRIQTICTLMNSIFLEAPQQIRSLLLSCAISPEALPYCVEYIPSFVSAVDMLPELLSKDTSTRSPSYRLYYADLASWLAAKYANPRFESIVPQVIDLLIQTNSFDSCMAALTIGTRLCIALPQICLLSLHPQLVNLCQKARLLATDKEKLPSLESRMSQIVGVLETIANSNTSGTIQYSCKI